MIMIYDNSDIKDEWRTIIRAYSNWFLTKKKWGGLKNTTHPKENIVDWCIKMGINEKNGEFENWIETGYDDQDIQSVIMGQLANKSSESEVLIID